MTVLAKTLALTIVYGWRPVAGFLSILRAEPELRYSPKTLLVSFVVTTSQLLVVGWMFRRDLIPILVGDETSLHLIYKCVVAIATILVVDIGCAQLGRFPMRSSLIRVPALQFDRQVMVQMATAWFWVYCMLAGATEELLFRGLPLFRLHSRVDVVVVMAMSSTLFASQHLRNSTPRVAYRVIFGIVFAIQFLAFGQLLPVIIGHIAGNWRVVFTARQMLAVQAANSQLQHSALVM